MKDKYKGIIEDLLQELDRKRNNLSYARMSKKVGISKTCLWRIHSGDHLPVKGRGFDYICRLLEIKDCEYFSALIFKAKYLYEPISLEDIELARK